MVKRIQRSRRSRQPPNTLYCGRPTKRGSPFPIGKKYTREEALDAFRKAFRANELPMTPSRARVELAEYDYLSCWCRLDQPCHVDEYIKAIHCEHEVVSDSSRRHCAFCKEYLHRDVVIEGRERPVRTAARLSSDGENRREHPGGLPVESHGNRRYKQ